MPYPMVEPTYTHASHEPCEPEGKVSQELTILNTNSFWHKAFLITYMCQECYTSSMRKAVSGQKMSHGCSRHPVPVPDYEISSWSIEISPLHAHHCLSSGTMSRLQSARGKFDSQICPPHAQGMCPRSLWSGGCRYWMSCLCCRPVIQIVPLLSREVRNARTLREHKAER